MSLERDELDRLRSQYIELFAENKILTKENIELQKTRHDLEIELVVLKEKYEHIASRADQSTRRMGRYFLDLIKLGTVASAFTAIAKSFEHFLK